MSDYCEHLMLPTSGHWPACVAPFAAPAYEGRYPNRWQVNDACRLRHKHTHTHTQSHTLLPLLPLFPKTGKQGKQLLAPTYGLRS